MRTGATPPERGGIPLRPLSTDDVEAQVEGQDDAIVRWVSGHWSSAAEQREALARPAQAWSEGAPAFDVGIGVVSTGQLAGMVGLQSRTAYLRTGQVNVTYALYPAFRGRGIVSEAVLLSHGLAHS